MQSRVVAAVIDSTVSAKKRVAIVKRAEELGVRVVNAGAKIKSVETE